MQTRERGALFINASYDAPAGTGPAIDWLTYEDVVETRDRLLQESVGFYDPGLQVIVFVLLPSKTGNSLAMWRRKVPVPNSVRLSHLREIELAKAALRKDYPVLVDEIRLVSVSFFYSYLWSYRSRDQGHHPTGRRLYNRKAYRHSCCHHSNRKRKRKGFSANCSEYLRSCGDQKLVVQTTLIVHLFRTFSLPLATPFAISCVLLYP